MLDFAKSREFMINSQLEPGGVANQALLTAFAKVPRENFLPQTKRSIAYVDEDIAFEKDKLLLEPVILGRMLQVADIQTSDIVLNIGDSTGYCSALLSDLVTTIVALESGSGMYDQARFQWAESDFCNIAVLSGKPADGCKKHAPYNLILINGAVSWIPETLKHQLTIGGRLVTILRKKDSGMGTITMIRRDGPEAFSSYSYYDAATPFLPGFEPKEAFSF